jgi:hypothetical protein
LKFAGAITRRACGRPMHETPIYCSPGQVVTGRRWEFAWLTT